jgi:hypothetical protein
LENIFVGRSYGPMHLELPRAREQIVKLFIHYSAVADYESMEAVALLTLLEASFDT